jgi:hypothetical protein
MREKIMEMLKTIYATFGAPHPIISLITVTIIGALLFGGVWFGIGKQYDKELSKTNAASVINTTGNVTSNAGIMTQGQHGDNTITPAPVRKQ